jgi:hypothetical protein
VYGGLQQSRGYIRDAITSMNTYLPTQTAQIGELYFALGIIELTLAENFCNGIPMGYAVDGVVAYTPSLTNTQVIALAVAHFDTALAIASGTDAATVAVRTATFIAKARTQVDQAQFSAAATTVSGVATSYQYLMTFTATTGGNGTWDLNWNRGGYSLADSFDTSGLIRNAIPFISANDPRLPVLNPKTGITKDFDSFQLMDHHNDMRSMLPTIDFDCLEYHLQGPKEYFQAGRISFLPHNVYTSMPFGVELLHLLGMEVLGDWWRGSFAGQFLVMLHAPAAAALICSC